MRVLIVTPYYPPETGAPQARLHELARRLGERGHPVSVLTGLPNYPTGRVFPGYRRRLRMTETIDGVRVTRAWLYASKSARALPRLLSYLSFAASGLVAGSFGLGPQDVALVESPPLFGVPTGLRLARWHGARCVMMVSDIWPDILVRMGQARPGAGLKLMAWLEGYCYRHADVVALTNQGAQSQVQQRFPSVRTTVISNGVDTTLFRPEKRSEALRQSLGLDASVFVAWYCGLHGLAQGLDAVLEAAHRLRAVSGIRFVMAGDGPLKEQLTQQARDRRLNNLLLLERRPKSEMPALLASCDASLVPLSTRLPGTMPSKLFEALAAGVPPIVARGCEGDPLVTQHDAGLVFEPGNGDELARAVQELASDRVCWARKRGNGLRLARRFDRDVIARRTEDILAAVASGRSLPDVPW